MSAFPAGGRNGQAVAIVRHSFYPFELNVKREAETLFEAGFDVHVICLRGPGEAKHEVIEGVHVHRLPVGHRRGKILRYLWEYNAFFVLAARKLAALHHRHGFAAVQVNTMPDYLVFVARYPKKRGAKVILHLHEPMPELFQTMFAGKWYARPFIWMIARVEQASIRFADRALTVTDQMRDNFVRRGADPAKFTVVVNVPDDRYFRIEHYEHLRAKVDAIKKDDRQRGVFRVVTHGSIEERYGYDTIVRAVARAAARISGIEFRFMGGGSDVQEILRLARTLGISDRVHYLGFVPFEEMVEEILLAGVCVVAVKKNPYSRLVHTNKMYEYMALERPLIVSRLDSVAAYMSEDAALYFEPGDDADLAARLVEAFEKPEETAARVVAATRFYRTHRWEEAKQEYLGRYRPD